MGRIWKRVVSILSATMLVLMLVLSAGVVSFAEEGDEKDVIEEETLEAGASYKVGDIIKFGHYEQDGNTANGKEEIEWEVLKVESDRILVVSKYALDTKPYNTEYADVTWENCSLRNWLNDDFKNAAFSQEEQKKIPVVTITNDDNPYYGTEGGNNTEDQVFCLSATEINNLIGYDRYDVQDLSGFSQKMIVEPTQYAISNGAPVHTITESEYNQNLKKYGYTEDVIGCCGTWWWLRSPGYNNKCATNVDERGYACTVATWSSRFFVSSVDCAVRPALYICIPKVYPESVTLDKTSVSMSQGDEMTLNATLTPEDVTETAIRWTTSDSGVATVTDGVVKAEGIGTATITAWTVNDFTATCIVTVNAGQDTSPYKVGDIINFGHYEQDGNEENGKEEIEWEVLKVESDRVLVVSKYALDCKPYNTEKTDVTWETCTLREWLNDDFKNSAFTTEEQKIIPIVTVVNENNPQSGMGGGNNTQDQLFCLSIDEVWNLIGYNYYDDRNGYGFSEKMIVEPTQYARNNGAHVYSATERDYSFLRIYGYSNDVIGRFGTKWWLRSLYSNSRACIVDDNGMAGVGNCSVSYFERIFSSTGDVNWESVAVRPAMYINTSEKSPESITLDKTSVSMAQGEQMTLTATLTPEDVTETAIRWTTNNPGVATVIDGVVKAKGAGTATITAWTRNGLTATCMVTVNADQETSPYKVGDIIKLGHYEQDGNLENGKEEIEWEVLKVESDRVLVISKYLLDNKQYHNANWVDFTWETCSLRKWLNNDFKEAAFTSEELEQIPTVTVVAEKDPVYGIDGGNDTQDQIFCLSLEEVKDLIGYNYFYSDYIGMYGYSQKLIAEPTPYAANEGIMPDTITEEDYNNFLKEKGYTPDVIGCTSKGWWLRTQVGKVVCVVDNVGAAGTCFWSSAFYVPYAVRPALYINIPSVNPESVSLDKTSATLNVGDEVTLKATLTPDDVTETKITWASSKPEVATVKDGVVKAISTGKTTITAKTINDLTAKCEITVIDKNSSDLFADIKADTWQYKSAKAVYDKGYMTGTGETDGKIVFSPNTNINRSQFVVALYSMDGKPETEYEQKFSDVKGTAWYAKQVTWASNNGIVAGNPDGTFGVNGKATREQLALMFYKYAKYKNYDVSVSPSTTLDSFIDAGKVSSWSLEAIKWAVERGIISGKGSAEAGYRIDPQSGATRIECAAMMNRFDEVYPKLLTIILEEEEEPLALPEEEMEDISIPGDEMDVIIEEDSEEEKTVEEDPQDEIIDEEVDSEEEPEKELEE